MTERVTISGVESVEAAYRTLEHEASTLESSWARVASLTVAAAQANAPIRTGALAGSIAGAGEAGRATFGVGVIYGGVIEWGWAARGIGPSMYLTRAILANQDQVLAELTAGLTAACAKAQGG